MDGSGFPAGGSFVPPIFAPGGGAHSDGSGSVGDLDDMFVDDFLSGGMFGDASAAPASHSFVPAAISPPAPVGGSLPLGSTTMPAAGAMPSSQVAGIGAGGFGLLQRSAAAAAVTPDALHPNAATLASIASNPSTSRSVALAALAASKAAEQVSVAGTEAVAAVAAPAGRARRPSAKVAAGTKKATASDRGSTKRALEASEMSDDEDEEDEDDMHEPKRRRSLNANERQARR